VGAAGLGNRDLSSPAAVAALTNGTDRLAEAEAWLLGKDR
jgi:hypothetical protein